MYIELTDNNFDEEVLKSSLPVLVDFWAPWCGPCKMLGPIIEEIAKEFQGKLKVGKCNVDENGAKASQFNVRSIPTILLFKDGKEIKQVVGSQPKDSLIAMFKDYI